MVNLGLVGIGAIARSQHIPVLQAHGDYQLVAAASRHGKVDGIANHPSLGAMLDAHPEIEAVALCLPPEPRYAVAREAIARGKHVFLEKPPGTTVGEVMDLAAQARAAGVVLFASWHSRYAPAVETFRERLASTTVRRIAVNWREDVREWHPGQTWLWEPGGFGVFDPGINAFSIMSHAFPRPIRLKKAVLSYPSNCNQPILAELTFLDAADVPVDVVFDFDQAGTPTWEMQAETEVGLYVLSRGGAALTLDGAPLVDEPEGEYRALYSRFAHLVRTGTCDVDVTPLSLVADCFLYAERRTVGPFSDPR